MKNNGLFSSLFIKELKDNVKLNDAAQGRMTTLAQTWRTRNTQDTESLWESFLKQALSYLEFVPPVNPTAPGVYPLYEDYNFSKCISVLYLWRLQGNFRTARKGDICCRYPESCPP